MKTQEFWATRDEIRFLENLGTHAPKVRATSPLTVEELYENYIKAARLRVNWGAIDKVVVIAKAKEMLARC